MQGWRYRMEDAHVTSLSIVPKVHLFCVFDGHGGKEVSGYASRHFKDLLVKSSNFNTNKPQALIDAFLSIDKEMQTEEGKQELKELSKLSKEEDERQDKANKKNNNDVEDKDNQLIDILKNSKEQQDIDIAMMTGCTSCVVLIDEAKKLIYFANAGDSRAILCKKGKAYQMSLDHKPDLFIEKNRIYRAGGWVNEGRIKGNLNLSRSLGDLEYKGNADLGAKEQMITAFPDIVVEKYSEECDFIIIGCDGIWDCLTNQEACDYVRERIEKMKLSEIVESMMDSIIADSKMNETGVGCDNMTCIIVKFKH